MEVLRVIGIAVCLTSLWTVSNCYKIFQERIPNGEHVGNPCKPQHIWDGVGHKQWEGGSDRNIFGTHFEENGFKWDSCLCNLDSDGDGLTNGEELGDPLCKWKPGHPPDIIFNITHPGLCEPLSDPKCEATNNFKVCTAVAFECDAIQREDVSTMELRLSPTDVPTGDYTRMCMTLDLPREDNHIIAWEPIIDNPYILHHVNVFGCTDEDYQLPHPLPCNTVGGSPCSQILFAWLLGSLGDCLPDNYGFLTGELNGITRLLLTVGWINPDGLKGHSDASGVKLYYTPRLRQYSLQTLAMGQNHLDIPPGRKEVLQTGWCGSKCTESLQNPIYLVQAFIIMHYHGKWAKVSLHRNGTEVATPVIDAEYRYPTPIIHRLDDAIRMLPGDELSITCAYNTLRQKTSLYWSMTAYGELCISFISYYTVKGGMGKYCRSLGSKHKGCAAYPPGDTGDCDVDDYIDSNFPSALASLRSSCIRYMCKFSCRSIIGKIRQNSCFDDEIRGAVLFEISSKKGNEGKEFADYVRSCEDSMYVPPDDGDDDDDENTGSKTDLCAVAHTGALQPEQLVILSCILAIVMNL